MKVYIDADACPVQEEVIRIARPKEIPVVLVKSFSHFSHEENPTGVETVYVDQGTDAADFQILQLANKGDVIVTQDYGLAALGLAKKCIVIHHHGFSFHEGNINHLLQSRHLSAKVRRGGGRTKGPKPFTKEDKKKFQIFFEQIIETNQSTRNNDPP